MRLKTPKVILLGYNPHKKKWKVQVKIKVHVADDVKACNMPLGLWGTEVEAASVLRAFFGVGFTTGLFVMPTYPSKATLKDACVAAIEAVAMELNT